MAHISAMALWSSSELLSVDIVAHPLTIFERITEVGIQLVVNYEGDRDQFY